MLGYICYYYTYTIMTVRQEGRPLSISKCQRIALWPLLPKYSSFGSESPVLQDGNVGLWHGAASGGVEALGLGWLHAGMGWEASSGSEWAGEPPSGLHRDVKAQRMMGSPGTARNTKISLPGLGSGTGVQTRWDIECYEMPQ